jgi:hypothetical protein
VTVNRGQFFEFFRHVKDYRLQSLAFGCDIHHQLPMIERETSDLINDHAINTSIIQALILAKKNLGAGKITKKWQIQISISTYLIGAIIVIVATIVLRAFKFKFVAFFK